MHGAETVERIASQCFNISCLGNVHSHSQHFCACCSQVRLGFDQGCLLYIDEDHFHALKRAARRQSSTNAAGCACDDRHLALEVFHGSSV